MSKFKKAFAQETIAGWDLEETNRALAAYWLSLWQGDELPRRAQFNPARLKPFLSSLILFDVVPDESVTVRLAGTGYRHILGTELTGRDWLDLAPPGYRANRLGLFSAVARGAIVMAHRRIAMTVGEDYVSEEILLPFAAGANGARPVLAYVNWKPEQFLKIKSVAQVIGDPLDFKLVPLEKVELVGVGLDRCTEPALL